MNPRIEEIVARLRHTSNVIGVPLSEAVLLKIAADLIEQLQQELIDERYRHDRLQDFCVAQGEELSKLKAQQRWIPVAQRLPEDGFEVMVYTDRYGGRHEFAYYVPRLGAWYQNCALLFPNVAHWMPLPEPPEEGE